MLNKLKLMLEIPQSDVDSIRDEKLKLILANATSRLRLRLGGIEPPAEMDYIILDVATMRFNRIGSEGLSAHSVEGESLSFKDSDFDGFAGEIQAFLDMQNGSTRGKMRFL